MVAWFKYKAIIAVFSGFVMRLIVANSNGNFGTCNGLAKDEKIIKVQPGNPAFISEGKDAMIFWTYCKANVTSITTFIIFREFRLNKVQKRYLLSMDLNGKVYFTRNKDHILWNRIDLMENDHLISFSIKNVSRNDSGYYRLEIRREGYGDLYSRVQIIVELSSNERPTTAKMRRRPTIKVTANTKKTNENNNTMSENSKKKLLLAILVPSALVIVLLTFGFVILIIYIKKGKEREGQETLINETLSLEVTS